MSLLNKLMQRSQSACELCTSTDDLKIYEVPPSSKSDLETSIMACAVCVDQIENPENVVAIHWRCLNESMWSEVSAVQIMAWRMLTRLKAEGWPQDLLDMLYLVLLEQY